ncbi:MAG TPA: T9SS type A sorting domain-containing protein, partial [Bacteroidia bacterium]|nr:T9SS type A sorting domain-containing protein [Bacteroidia bacterium]
AGGEYGAGATRGEVYDPVANTWTNTNAVTGNQNIYDGNSEILYNGTVLVGLQSGNNPSFDDLFYTNGTNNWTTAPQAPLNHDEAAWLKLPDSSTLFIGINSTNSCRYIPQTNTWVTDATVPVQIYDPYGEEAGPAFMLPNGKAVFFGASAHNVMYTPSGNTSPGTWTQIADFPVISGTQVSMTDAAGCMMVNGHILLAVSPINTSNANQFLAPIYFLEYDYTTNTFTQVTSVLPTIGTDQIAGVPCNFSNMLQLPNGQVMLGESEEGVNQYWVYTPGSAAIPQGKPTINAIIPGGCPNYKLTGKLFNGISEGAGFGDDWQMETNYPIIRLSNGTNVYYCKTTNWNRIGALQTDSLEDTVSFSLPAALPAGTYSLVVTANGFASNPTIFKTLGITIASHTNATCAVGGTATANAATGGLQPYTYSWSPAGGTNLAATGLSGGSYTITVTDHNGCTATASVTITQPMLTITIAATTGANCSSAGSARANAASGGTSPYTYNWTPSGGTNLTASNLSAGVYTITATDKNGCQGFATATITQPVLNISIASQTNSNCIGSGSATANAATGGTAPYTYSWSPNGGTNLTATGLSAGTYTITATDRNGCTGTASVTISAAAYTTLFSQNFEGTATIYKNNVVMTGGTPATIPASQTWGSANANDGNNTLHRDDAIGTWASNDDICGQAYQPIPTCAANGTAHSALFDNWDANTATTGNIISPVVNLSSANCGTKFTFYYFNGDCRASGSQATLALQFNNGSGYTTVWSDLVGCTTSWVPVTVNIPSADLVANFKFQFLVTAGDLNGDLYPVGVDEIVIQTPSALSTAASGAGLNCFGSGTATAAPCGGATPYTYLWSNAKTTATISGLTQGSYSVTVTDSCGNSSTASTIILTQPSAITMVKTSTVDHGPCNGTAKVSASGGTPPYTYLWSPNNQTTDSIGNQCAGTYCCTVTDHNGCVDSICVLVNLSTGINAISNSSAITVYPNPNNGSFTIQSSVVSGKSLVEIYNVLGEKVYSNQPLANSQQLISINLDQPSGVYFYRVVNESGSLLGEGKLVIIK